MAALLLALALCSPSAAARQPWTDDPVVAGETPVKAVHVEEIRRRVDELRQARGLPPAVYTSRPSQGSAVQSQHFAETISALAAVYDEDGAEPPAYGLVAPGEPIRALTINALRAAITGRVGREAAGWRGLEVAAEDRCAPYDADDYPYPQSVEDLVIDQLGGIYSPYTCESFESKQETDIEHIVARSEAHDSGLCAADAATKRQFAQDLLNLTLAPPELNRHEKGARDAAEWQPPQNGCWFAQRVIEVKLAYGLTVDQAEVDALDRVLSGCASTEIACELEEPKEELAADHPPVESFRNCTLMRAAGWDRGVNVNGGTYQPAWDDAERRTYQMNTGRDRDRDGHACE